jgi:hypothetical protein
VTFKGDHEIIRRHGGRDRCRKRTG